jgi:hypothetical protein
MIGWDRLTQTKDRAMDIRRQVDGITRVFAEGLTRILGGKLYSAYIHGAAALPDAVPTGDVDFHVVLESSLSENEKSRLYELHDRIAGEFPPLGVDMDGYYILLEDARRAVPPRSEMWDLATDRSWALHRAHLLAGRVIVLYGPVPGEIMKPPEWDELKTALDWELSYVRDHLLEYPHYSILQLCRLVYSYETKNVVISKAEAAAWGENALVDWGVNIGLARKAYAGRAGPEEYRLMRSGLEDLLDTARKRRAAAFGMKGGRP